MYRIPVMKISLVRESSASVEYRKIESPYQAADVLRAFLGDTDREHCVALLLDTRNTVVGINMISMGSLNASIVHPRETFKAAILANANAVIIGHNHPTGDPSPSTEDLALTKRLKDAGELLGIQVLDHVVLGEGETFYSFQQRHLF